ncbi:tyrosine-type recombinase/integrase [Streptacidiphilus cavernicola]|uniref:Tyrosine-type recombinase/integrase n=1 Tax=Streptacidiphilus cavernicola TaxID=3342716 RepID=A0ABV6W2V9_9ACTN
MLDESGQPMLTAGGKPRVRYLEKDCPRLAEPDHGSWYYSFELPTRASGERRPRAKAGGFVDQEAAAEAAEKAYLLSKQGVDITSRDTVESFLTKWMEQKRPSLSVTTAYNYQADIDLYFIPHLGKIQLVKLSVSAIQEMYDWITEDNERRIEHRAMVEELAEQVEQANKEWRATPRKPAAAKAESRAKWVALRDRHLAERKNLRRVTGPGTMKSINNTLSSALSDAVRRELIPKNFADHVLLPKYVRAKALLWTPQRVKRWKRTGLKPSPVMVWTTELTAEFMDFVSLDRLISMWHVINFRGPRRGEAAGLTWDEVDLKAKKLSIVEQRVSVDYVVHTKEPKADSMRDLDLDTMSVLLLKAWRKQQKAEQAAWEAAGLEWGNTGNHVWTKEDGTPYHPEAISDMWNRLVEKSGLPPVRLHDGRHNAGSQSFAAGAHPKVIQAMLGHSTVRLSMDVYTTLMTTTQQAAAEASVELVQKAMKKLRKQRGKEAARQAEQGDDDGLEGLAAAA